MRCAILRLMSVGEPATGPWAVRDSEAMQQGTGKKQKRGQRRGEDHQDRPRGEEEARLLKLRRDRRELSDRGAKPDLSHSNRQGRDLPSGREPPHTCRKPCRDPITVCEDDAGEPRGKVEKKCGNRRMTG